MEDVLRLGARSDPSASDEKKLRVLMRGLKDKIFGGLVRNPPITVKEFVAEATSIERALQARAGRYHRSVNVAAHTTSGLGCRVGLSNLREIIRGYCPGGTQEVASSS